MLSVPGLKGYERARGQVSRGVVKESDALSARMRRFQRSRRYTVLTPDSPLLDLARFFEREEFAIITDAGSFSSSPPWS